MTIATCWYFKEMCPVTHSVCMSHSRTMRTLTHMPPLPNKIALIVAPLTSGLHFSQSWLKPHNKKKKIKSPPLLLTLLFIAQAFYKPGKLSPTLSKIIHIKKLLQQYLSSWPYLCNKAPP